MYRRLPHGPHGMEREEVARHQRARLYGGMIESIAQHGYAGTTVAHVIGLAGVSRRAFYEQFANKEECFLATYDIVVARARKLSMDAWAQERGWANRLHAACKAMIDDVAEDPRGAHLVLVDSLGVGPRARERMLLAACTFERTVKTGYDSCPDGIKLQPLLARAVVAGARHVAFKRLHDERPKDLFSITDELLDWIESYRTPLAARVSAIGLARPPHVPPQPAAFLASDDKRSRVLGSVVHLTLDEGYSALTDPQIAQFAGISTEAFHKQFPSKEACFLAVLDEFAGEATDTVHEAIRGADSWSEAVCLGVSALVEYFISHPGLLRMAFIDVFEVGPGMVDRVAGLIDGATKRLADSAPDPRRAPALVNEAVAGAIWGIVSSYAPNDRLRYLACFVDQISFVVMAPYVGPKAALEAIEEARNGPSSAETPSPQLPAKAAASPETKSDGTQAAKPDRTQAAKPAASSPAAKPTAKSAAKPAKPMKPAAPAAD
jgi:AcrR family transcriptional regulator